MMADVDDGAISSRQKEKDVFATHAKIVIITFKPAVKVP